MKVSALLHRSPFPPGLGRKVRGSLEIGTLLILLGLFAQEAGVFFANAPAPEAATLSATVEAGGFPAATAPPPGRAESTSCVRSGGLVQAASLQAGSTAVEAFPSQAHRPVPASVVTGLVVPLQ